MKEPQVIGTCACIRPVAQLRWRYSNYPSRFLPKKSFHKQTKVADPLVPLVQIFPKPGENDATRKATFIAKLSDAETEACETQVWLEFANLCGYIDEATFKQLDEECDRIMGQLVRMIEGVDDWLIK